ncbi:hypothetical protein BKA67DRAFT_523023 [Truncatella angustata]|uniref:Uncharacterized protein n=1 Tax=Truncatella angustata TaxID=152316 RepID=A0A9P8ZVN0_9PEZI|nr:uncharacterized protein BKA67DRAFT_523023 [Truncatella angustata]KAH6649058.1 hypothetical protein BKA67DRAFT_523023 [Truncatella angustata]
MPTFNLDISTRANSGSYTVSGLGSRKQAITAAGGTTLDIAIAMLETDTMTANYTYGDGKTYDSANFGIMKQNWGMLRECSSQFKGDSVDNYNDGAVLNSNLGQDVTACHECQNYYGVDKWFRGHRNGASGLMNSDTTDINNYKEAVYWIQSQIQSSSSFLTDDTRFWVDVTAI